MVCPHPLYSSDLALCKFWFCPKEKMSMKGQHFDSIQDTEAATISTAKDTHERGLAELLQKVTRTMGKCVQSEGEYFDRG